MVKIAKIIRVIGPESKQSLSFLQISITIMSAAAIPVNI